MQKELIAISNDWPISWSVTFCKMKVVQGGHEFANTLKESNQCESKPETDFTSIFTSALISDLDIVSTF